MIKIIFLIVCIIFFAILSNIVFAYDFLLVDRGSDQDVFHCTSDGQFSRLTNGVPWEKASSGIIESGGSVIVAVYVYPTFPWPEVNYNGLYRISNGTISAIAIGEPFIRPSAMAVDRDGNYIVVDQGYGPARIIKVTPNGQVFVIYEATSALHNLENPTDIEIDGNGHYVITDHTSKGVYSFMGFTSPIWYEENGSVYRFNPENGELSVVLSSVDDDGYLKDELLGHLAGLAIDSNGNYIIVEAPPHLDDGKIETPTGYAYLHQMSPSGDILKTTHIPHLNNLITLPLDIEIDPDGNYIVADAIGTVNTNGRILKITPNGNISIVMTSNEFESPVGLFIEPIPSPTLSADLDGNGKVGLEDCIGILQIVANVRQESGLAGDADRNGTTDLRDVIEILKMVTF
jgi:DNA-binding beta-propeller fold protein YncE